MAFLKFIDLGIPEGQKTRRWRVQGQGGFSLGQVRFYPGWRKYCFFPDENTVFDNACLGELADFLRTETQCWRANL